jgi:hypothetical protein
MIMLDVMIALAVGLDVRSTLQSVIDRVSEYHNVSFTLAASFAPRTRRACINAPTRRAIIRATGPGEFSVRPQDAPHASAAVTCVRRAPPI